MARTGDPSEPALEIVLEATTVRGAGGQSDRFQVRVCADADGDRLDDNWELRYGLDTSAADALADRDQDGASNLAEWQAGTDPTDANSGLRVCSFRLEGDTAHIRFTTELGRRYVVEASSALQNPDWSPVAEAVAGSGDAIETVDRVVGSPTRFYRVRLLP